MSNKKFLKNLAYSMIIQEKFIFFLCISKPKNGFLGKRRPAHSPFGLVNFL